MGLKLNLTFLFFLKMPVWQSLNFSSEMSYSQISFTSILVVAILLRSNSSSGTTTRAWTALDVM